MLEQHAHLLATRAKAHEPPAQGHAGAGALGQLTKLARENRSVDHEVGTSRREGRHTAIGEQLVVLDFIQDGPPADTTQDVQHAARDDERPRSPLQTRGLLEQLDPGTRQGQMVGGK